MKAVLLYQEGGKTAIEISNTYGISTRTIRRWLRAYSAGGSVRNHVICGSASNIAYVSKPHAGGGEGLFTHPYSCDGPSGCPCYCLSEEDCLPNCEYCDNSGPCAGESPFDPYNGCCWKCVDLCFPYGSDLMCKATTSEPDGECVSIGE